MHSRLYSIQFIVVVTKLWYKIIIKGSNNWYVVKKHFIIKVKPVDMEQRGVLVEEDSGDEHKCMGNECRCMSER